MSVYISEFREMKFKQYIITFLFMSCITFTKCFPTGNIPVPPEAEQSEEKKFLNGTVIGSYTYKDKDGNPIQVKYFADDSNYGVELKSFKFISSTGKPVMSNFKDQKTFTVPDTEKTELPEEDVSPNPKAFRALTDDPTNTHLKADKSSPDFETYYQNDVIEPNNKCGKSKVRVYYDKERRSRNALDNFEADKYCDQF